MPYRPSIEDEQIALQFAVSWVCRPRIWLQR